jgi:hypothetical protein
MRPARPSRGVRGRTFYRPAARRGENSRLAAAALACRWGAGPQIDRSRRREVIAMQLKTDLKAGLKAERVQEQDGSH